MERSGLNTGLARGGRFWAEALRRLRRDIVFGLVEEDSVDERLVAPPIKSSTENVRCK